MLTRLYSDLAALDRHPEVEHLYTTTFKKAVHAQYGSTEAYLHSRLNFSDTPLLPDQYFRADGSDDDIRVIPNDWAYGVNSSEIHHDVLWSRLPILRPNIPSKLENGYQKGLSGFTQTGSSRVGNGGHTEAACEIHKFVSKRWPESEGWTTAWYVGNIYL